MRTIVLVVDNYAPFEGIVTLCNMLISNDDKLVTKAIARGAAHALPARDHDPRPRAAFSIAQSGHSLEQLRCLSGLNLDNR